MPNFQSRITNHESRISDLPCVIFAGGKSSRMGRDKALLPFGDYDTLAEYQYRRLSKIFETVYISAKEDKFSFEAPVIPDKKSIFAPMVGILTVMKRLETDFFALSVDSPFVDEGIVAGLYEVYKSGEYDSVVAKTPSGIHPMCAIYRLHLYPMLQKLVKEGDLRLNALLRQAKTAYVEFGDEKPFFNMNRRDEYETAAAMQKEL